MIDDPAALLLRLQEIPGYTWKSDEAPFHSSFDNWHVLGSRKAGGSYLHHSAKLSPSPQLSSSDRQTYLSGNGNGNINTKSPHRSNHIDADNQEKPIQVVARASTHVLRIEREFQLAKRIQAHSDPEGQHFVRPIELVRLPAGPGGEPLVVSIFESPGPNYVRHVVQMKGDRMDLMPFLDFAVGAAQCLEILHIENRLVHGEIRGDVFHLSDAGEVRMLNYGGGARVFENGLTTAGWFSLVREAGIEQKLQGIAPEQTGRLPAEPDSRTDLYSLGILFWSLLVGQGPFAGDDPLTIMQAVLSRRVPPVASKRMDIPVVLSDVIAKLTTKNIEERYRSASGLKFDLLEIRKFLGEGDSEGLKGFEICSKDVSSFFRLPTQLIGRKEEIATLLKAVESVSKGVKRQDIPRAQWSLSSSSSTSDNFGEILPLEDLLSDSTSSTGSIDKFLTNASPPQDRPDDATPKLVPSSSPLKDQNQNSTQIGSTGTPLSQPDGRGGLNSYTTSSSGLPVRTGSGDASRASYSEANGRRKGNCRLIAITGAAGVGKSSLVTHGVQAIARQSGYFATAKFDQARKMLPFETVLRLMSSLFRQIFSESDVSTEFHQTIRNFVKPIWSVLHGYLDLPAWLLDADVQAQSSSSTRMSKRAGPAASQNSNRNILSTLSKKDADTSGNIAADWLRSGGSTRTSRFTNIFLSVLRMLATQRFVCLAVEDLHWADQESLELLAHIAASKVPLLLITTSRQGEQLPKHARALLRAAKQIELVAFTEEETAAFVAATMHTSDISYIIPLVAVVQEKTAGNPFFVREMLESCYRERCIYYSWRHSAWQFDLDKVFTLFESQVYGSLIGNDFISKRLDDLPYVARCLLAWASLIGATFSFGFVKQLMTGVNAWPGTQRVLPLVPEDSQAVAGLQSALGAFWITQAEEEEKFRWSHDRYMTAAADALLGGFNKAEMEFCIAKTMVLDPKESVNSKALYIKSQHICASSDLLRERETIRAPYRRVLASAAEVAEESGARASVLYYLQHCLRLLQSKAWNDQMPDVNFQETLVLHNHLAENYWYLGHLDEALQLVDVVFDNARSISDASPCWVIKSRVLAVQGDTLGALNTLKTCLGKMNFTIPPISWEECDDEFYKVRDLIKSGSQPSLNIAVHQDFEILGPILVELASAAFWNDTLLYYYISMAMVKLHIAKGEYPQAGLGYLQYATIAVGRFDMTEMGCKIAEMAKELFSISRTNPYTFGRGTTLHALFFGHLQGPLPSQIPVLQNAAASSVLAGDRILSLLNTGITAAYRLWSSHDLATIEGFCNTAPMEFNWKEDLRGGIFITSVRQCVRALQGKTDHISASTILNDSDHNAADYVEWIKSKASHPERQLSVYLSYNLILLFRFGYSVEAVELGEKLLPMSANFFCARYHYSNLFYLSLAYLACILEGIPLAHSKEKVLVLVGKFTEKIKTATTVNDVNYKAWLLLLGGQVAEIQGNYGTAIQLYEEALDHCALHEFTIDEGLVLEIYGQSLARRGARRPARRILAECLVAYRSIGAYGKAEHVARKYDYIFNSSAGKGYISAGTQTDVIATANTSFNLEQNETQTTQQLGEESSADRTSVWAAPTMQRSGSMIETVNAGDNDIRSHLAGMAGGLDMIDLASILESTHVLSSELQVDKLLSKMTGIILDSSGAEFTTIVRKGAECDWTIASKASVLDGVTAYIEELPLDSMEDTIHKQVISWVLRSSEEVFVRNHLEDERFSAARTTCGRAIIATPIFHGVSKVLGCILVDGPVNSFTERHVALLHLLVSQVSISLANALYLKQIEKVSEENKAMVEMQKRSLAAARVAETKAKRAEAVAIRNFELKEEATQAQQLFFANISHELRTPLNGVIGMSELLKETSLTTKQIGFTDSIRVCADLLLSVINDLLDFTKLQAGKMSLNSVPINLWETIREVLRALSFQNKAKGLQTLEQLEIREDMLVFGDSVRITQILMNLIGNSYKFTTEGTVTIRATVKEEDAESIHIIFSVIDTGIGIDLDKQKILFQPFSQIEQSSNRKFGGTGLGLSICRALLDVMGGTIWLESEPGVGTNVSFAIKFNKLSDLDLMRLQTQGFAAFEQQRLNADMPPQDGNRTPPGIIDLSHIPRDELRICIAEDNHINQKIAISFVQKLGFKCEAYLDGQQTIYALERASAAGKPYHLVLMDVQMPHLDGYDATRAIRKHKDPAIRNVLVIAMTASAITGDREKCLEAGMNDYLMKPVRANTLKTLLESYLSQPAKAMPDLQEQANQLAKDVIQEAISEASSPTTTSPQDFQRASVPDRTSHSG